MARAKGNGRDVLVERMVELLTRIERNTAEMRTELREVKAEVTLVKHGLQQVNDRLDGIRDIAGEKYREIEQRVSALERKVGVRP